MSLEAFKDHDRVTAILAQFSGVLSVNKDILMRAANRGSLCHKYIESRLLGDEFDCFEDEVIPYLNSYQMFLDGDFKEFLPYPKKLELRLGCSEKMITGAIDLIVEKEGKTYAFDWKTSSRPQKSWPLQAAAYEYLLKMNGFPDPQPLTFVHLKKSKKPTAYTYDDPLYLETFFQCLGVYRYFNMKSSSDANDFACD